jgi:hypothetical protein
MLACLSFLNFWTCCHVDEDTKIFKKILIPKNLEVLRSATCQARHAADWEIRSMSDQKITDMLTAASTCQHVSMSKKNLRTQKIENTHVNMTRGPDPRHVR